MVHTIIFSKDRACQLDLLLRTYLRFFQVPSVATVLYKATTEEYKQGYEQLKARFKIVTFVEETNFKANLVALFPVIGCDRVMFLVDDDVFLSSVTAHDPVIITGEHAPEVLAVSLRLGENIVWEYNHGYVVPAPRFEVPISSPASTVLNLWNWVQAPVVWNYVMSVDGNIFNVHDVVNYVLSGDYNNPNTFESWMAKRPNKRKPYTVCYPKSRLFGMCLNRVQSQFKSKHGSTYSLEDLNKRYLQGERISFKNFVGFVPNACHCDFPELLFEKQPVVAEELC